MTAGPDRILTTHAGSLPRPVELVQLYDKRARGEAIDAQRLDELGRRSTVEVVRQQADSGIDIGNNGEQQREGFFLYVQHRMSGFGGSWERLPPADVSRYPVFARERAQAGAGKVAVSNFHPPTAIGDVKYLTDAYVHDECDTFAGALTQAQSPFEQPFMTAPSPGIVCAAMKNEHYDTFGAYIDAVSRALQVEYEAIVEHGYLLQLDCPDLALERHITYQDQPVGDFIGFVEQVVDALNRSLVNIPRERVRMHVCWGNYEGPHDCDVPLEDILPTLLQADVGGLVLPFANPRHAHEYRVLERFPLADDQTLVAGVIDTLTNFVEHPEVVAERIERIVQVVGDPGRVQAGTDCGFDTSAGMGRVAQDVVWAKLRSLSAGARLASERLF
jgi:5-methyltetrahydropteroyltriglutamate--homocysteine methyltransferase